VKDISMILVDNLLTKKPQLQDKFKAALGENWKKESDRGSYVRIEYAIFL
jgi:hypothetical protein